MKKTIISLENNIQSTDLIFRTTTGYDVKPKETEGATTGMNYLNDFGKYKVRIGNSRNDFNELERQQLTDSFAEYIDGYDTYVTNIGLIAFYKNNKLVIYDILYKEETNLDDISFDLSPFDSYDEFSTPMNHYYVEFFRRAANSYDLLFSVRKVFTQGGRIYYKVPSDYILNGQAPNDSGLFAVSSSISAVEDLEYTFSQGIRIKQIRSIGNLPINVVVTIITDGNEITIVNPYVLKVDEPLDIDLSNYPNGRITKFSMSFDSEVTLPDIGSYGLLEVIC